MLSQQRKIAKSNLDQITKDEKSLKEAAAKKIVESGVVTLTKKVFGAAASKALGGIVSEIVVNTTLNPPDKDCAPGAKPPYCVISPKPIAAPAAVKSQAPITKSTSVAAKPTPPVTAKPGLSTTKVMVSLAKTAPKAQVPTTNSPIQQRPIITKKTIVPAKPSGAILQQRPIIRRQTIQQQPVILPQRPIIKRHTVKQQPAIPTQRPIILKRPLVITKALQPAVHNSQPERRSAPISAESRYQAVTDSYGNSVTTSGGGIVVTDSSRDYYDSSRWSGYDGGNGSDRDGFGTGGGFSGCGGDSPGHGGKGCK